MVKPRPPVPTVQFLDSYCELYQDLFPEVRSFESFKYLHLGIIADIKRKTLPAIAKVVGLDNEQSLHHFLTKSPWSSQKLRTRRIRLYPEPCQQFIFFDILASLRFRRQKNPDRRADYL